MSVALLATAVYIYQQSHQAAMPQVPAAVTQVDPIDQHLEQLSTRQKLASLLMFHVSGTNPQPIATFIHDYHPGGIIVMGDNLTTNLTQVKALTHAMQAEAKPFPIFIAIDEEGCLVKRLPQDTYPCAKDLGSQPVSATEQAFNQRSQLLQNAGINLNFGIVADITANPESFIYPRVFGSDPNQVGKRVAAAVKASQPTVLATIKHFPGHGQTTADSHQSIPRITSTKQDWQNHAAIPFKAGIKAKADAVMISHLTYTQIDAQPASLSPKWHDILRQELGFNGLIVTDDLIMLQQSGEAAYQNVVSNVIASINAGNNITLLVNDHRANEQPQTQINVDTLLDSLVTAVETGKISQSTLRHLAYQNLQWRSKLTSNSD